jgi:hypothetical protein
MRTFRVSLSDFASCIRLDPSIADERKIRAEAAAMRNDPRRLSFVLSLYGSARRQVQLMNASSLSPPGRSP